MEQQFKCKICNREFSRCSSLSSHISKIHKISAQEYYDTYLKSNSDEGYCKTCGKPTNFFNISHGYFNFCSNRCIGLNSDIQNQKKITTRKHFGVDFPSQSEEVQKTKIKTLQEKYNCNNSYNIPEIKEKAQINSHTDEANKKRGQSLHKTKFTLMKNEDYKQSIINKAKVTNQQKYNVDWHSNLDSVKYRISKSVKNAYLTDHTLKSRIRKSYIYDSIRFDSSYELALYIYAIDHNEQIIREPCKFTYVSDGKTKTYTPDFLYNGQYIEIKGPQFFNENGLINPFSEVIEDDKLECIYDNNVQIYRYNDILKFLQYCTDKFGTMTWYQQFKRN